MWFVIGLITTIGYIIYFFRKKIKASWAGINAICDGTAYEYYPVRNKEKIERIKIGIRLSGQYDFIIKPEKWHDRLFKWLGLSVEFQLNNPEFDKKFYVVSDNVTLLESIAKAGHLHNVIDTAFDSPKYCAQTTEMRCNSERLWLEYRCEESFSEGDISEIAAAIIPLLKNIADYLASEAAGGRSGFDRYALRAALILGISTGLAVNGVFHFLRMQLIKIPFTIDTHQLMISGSLVAVLIVGALIFCTICFLGRTSRAHLVFIEVLFIGSFGAFLTSTEELRDFNIEMDTQSAQQFTQKVHRKTIQHRRKSQDSYYLHINNWLRPEEKMKIDVGPSLYSQIREGDYVVISQRPGRLGYRWVEKVSKSTLHD